MSQPNDLIASLRSEGSLDARGHFKLDAQKAREKMRKFQLEDPHHYVLEFVAAATLLGATRVDFTIDADEMTMTFDRGRLSPEQLEDLYSAAFVRSEDPSERAMRLLAIGATAAGALDFSVLTIESGLARLDILDSGDSLSVTRLDAPQHPSRIYMRERRRVGHLVDFLSNLRGDLAEKTALRERCLYSHVHVTLDGERISRGHTLPPGTKGAIAFETEHERGVLGFLPGVETTEVHMLQHGVLVSSYHAESPLVSVRAVVDSDRLTKNLSQSAFVEDDAWSDIFGNVLRATLHASLAEHMTRDLRLKEGGPSIRHHDNDDRRWLQDVALHVFDEVARWDAAQVTPSPQTLHLCKLLSLARVWEVCDQVVVDGKPSKYISLEEALELGNGTSMSFAEASFRGLDLPPGFDPVLLSRKNDRVADVLSRYTGLERRSAAYEVEVAQERRRNRARWRRAPHDGSLDATAFPIQASHEGDGLRITAGRDEHGAGSFKVVLVHDGHVLRHNEVDSHDARSGVTVVVSGTLPLDRRHGDVLADEAYARAVAPAAGLIFDVMERFFLELPEGSNFSGYARRVLLELASPRMFDSVMFALGVRELRDDKGQRDRLLESLPPAWSIHRVLERESSLERRALALDSLGAFATRRVVPALGGERVSLRDLMRDAKRSGSAWILDHGELDAELRRDWAAAGLENLVVADEEWTDVARAYCAPHVFRAAGVIRATARRKRFLERPAQAVEVEPGEVLARRGLAAGPDGAGEIVLRRHATPGTLRARFFISGRLIDSVDLEMPVGVFDAAFEKKSLRVDPSWEGLERDDAFGQACALLREDAFGLIESRLLALERTVSGWSADALQEFLGYVVGLNTADIHAVAAAKATSLTESIEGFARVDGGLVSYRRVREEVARYGRRVLLVSSHATVDAAYVPSDMADAPVFLLRAEYEREAFGALFPDAARIDVGHTAEREAEAARARAEFLLRAPLSPERPDAVASADVRAGRFVGRLHLLQSNTSEVRGRVDVMVLHEERLLVRLSHPVEMGYFVAVVDVDGLRPATDYSGALAGEDLASSCVELTRPALELLRDAMARARHGQELCGVFGERSLRLLTHARNRSSTPFERALLDAPTLTLHPDLACSVNQLFASCAEEGVIRTKLGAREDPTPIVGGGDVLCLRDEQQLAAARQLFLEFEVLDHSSSSMRQELFSLMAGVPSDGDDEVLFAAAASTPASILLERVRGALKAARGDRMALLGDEDLAHLEVASLGGAIASAQRASKVVHVDLDHPVARAALDHPDDPIALHMLAASIYSEINARERRITDAHEADLLRALARSHLRGG